jgi:hypothetical protein
MVSTIASEMIPILMKRVLLLATEKGHNGGFIKSDLEEVEVGWCFGRNWKRNR